jgi:hypothetical protein
VPWPGPESTRRRPPIISTRSRMLTMPNGRSAPGPTPMPPPGRSRCRRHG